VTAYESELGEVAGFCEHGNEPSGSIKGGGISSLAERLLASEEGLGSMESVIEAVKLFLASHVYVWASGQYKRSPFEVSCSFNS
jgi:hypothetical protein